MIRLIFSSSLYWPDIGGIEMFGKERLPGRREHSGASCRGAAKRLGAGVRAQCRKALRGLREEVALGLRLREYVVFLAPRGHQRRRAHRSFRRQRRLDPFR
jgi:hypothetical protein